MCARSEVADVTGFVKYNRKSVFRHQNVGGGGGGYGPLSSPCFAAYVLSQFWSTWIELTISSQLNLVRC